MIAKGAITAIILVTLGAGVYVIAGREMRSTRDIYEYAKEHSEEPNMHTDSLTTISPEAFASALTGRTIIDVRTSSEYESGHMARAINIDFYDPNFEAQLEQRSREVN